MPTNVVTVSAPSLVAKVPEDRATGSFTGALSPARSGETYVEVSYQYQATPWWQLQPDIQYVFNPGGGIANPNNPTTRVKNELVLGLRTLILF